MVNFHNPAVIARDFLAADLFWHALTGLYFWEFVTTLDYEWSVIRGRRSYRWTIVIYSITRVATLLAIILSIFALDTTTRYNCQARITSEFLFGYLAFSADAFLIVLRIIAIWEKNKLVTAIATGVWAINLGFQLHSFVQLRASPVPGLSICVVRHTDNINFNSIPILISDIALLLIMLIGLLRMGFHESGMSGFGRLIWRQGLIWLFLATIAEVPPVVFMSLNLNDPLNYVFNFPALITMSIAATRIYRSLADFNSSSTNIAIVPPDPIAFATPRTNRVPAQTITLETVEVAANGTYEQYQTPRTSRNDSSISGEESLCEKPASLGLDYDVERGAESGK